MEVSGAWAILRPSSTRLKFHSLLNFYILYSFSREEHQDSIPYSPIVDHTGVLAELPVCTNVEDRIFQEQERILSEKHLPVLLVRCNPSRTCFILFVSAPYHSRTDQVLYDSSMISHICHASACHINILGLRVNI